MSKTLNLVFFIMFCIVPIFFSCSRYQSINSVKLPSTPEVSKEGRYALVLDPYISMRDQPGDLGITVAHGRRGEIYQIQGTKIINSEKKNVIWIDLGVGWTPESSIQLYSSEEKAHTASKSLK